MIGGADPIPELQGAVDALDARVVDLLRQRFDLSRQIGRIKFQNAAPPFDPSRVAARRARFLLLCQQAGFTTPMAVGLFDLIADQVAADRRALFGGSPATFRE